MNRQDTMILRPAGRAIWLVASAVTLLAGCSKGPDQLRDGVPPQGVAATVQIDLPRNAAAAQIAATVYKDAVAQPLVGGDVLQARTDTSLVTLRAFENLSGHYEGVLAVDHAATPIDLAVNYDQQASAEERWFASDELLVNPGPGSLVGYTVTGMRLPQEIYLSAPAANAIFRTTADTVQVNWDPVNEGDQVRLTAAVACRAGTETTRYGLTHNLGIEGGDADAAGSYSLELGELVNGAPVLVTLQNAAEYIALVVTATTLGLPPQTLVGELNDVVTLPNEIDGCDIDLTLFRERDNALPEAFSGGYAITSRSDTVRIQYVPE